MNIEKDWKALSETWQGQAAPDVDVEAVRGEVWRRGRSLRRKLGLEVVTVVVYGIFCAYVVQRPESDTFERVLFTAMGLFLVIYQGFFLWLRRRELSDTGLDVQSLVDLELRRCHTTLRYWRIGMWTGVAMWVALYAVLMLGLHADWPRGNLSGLAGGLLANVLLMPGFGLFAVWRTRQELARIARYRDLQAQLRAP